MHDELVRLLPGPLQGPGCRRRQDRLLRQPEARRSRPSPLGGQGISVVSYSDKQDEALEYIKWFAQPDVQKKWWSLGGYSCHKAVLLDPGFPATRALRRRLPEGDVGREGLLAGAGLRRAAAGDAEAGARLRRRRPGHGARRRSTCWSRTGPRSSRTKASSSPVRSRPLPGRLSPCGRGGPRLPGARTALSRMSEASSMPRLAERAARATPLVRGRARARAVGPGDRLAVHHADDRACCSRSTSSR